MGVHTEAVQQLYVAYFSRPADAAGLTYWEGVVAANNGSTAAISETFANSQEYKDTFAGQSQYQVVNTIYMNLFGRPAEPAGLAYWGQALINGTFTVAEAVTTIAGGAKDSDATAYANKVKAATAFTEALDTSAEILGYSGTNANLAAKAWLAGVTTDASLTAAVVPATLNASIGTVIANGNSSTGQNFTLTSTIGEQVTGTAGSDVFTAVVDTATTSTFNTGDNINGLGGQDTLNLLVTSNATQLPVGTTVSNIEIVNVTYAGAVAADLGLDSANFGGVQQLWQVASATGSTFQDVTVGTGVTAGFRSTGNAASAAAATATVTAAAGVTAVAVALDGVDDGSTITLADTAASLSTVTVSGSVATTAAVAGTPAVVGVDVNGNGDYTDAGDTAPVAAVPAVAASNVLTLTAAAAADIDTLNLSLTSNTTVVISALDDLNTVNASGSTGNLTINLGSPDELRSATFGSGNDIVTLNTGSLAVAAGSTTGTLAIDLGAGNDVLNLSAGANPAAIATTITLGAGNDTLAIATLANLTAVSATGITNDLITVTDFNAAQDVLDLSALGTAVAPATGRDVFVNTELANIAAAADFSAALALAASYTAVNSYSVFNYGGDAYIFNNVAGEGLTAGDGLVKIVGLSVDALNGTNFVA